jgi:hypothetical protein
MSDKSSVANGERVKRHPGYAPLCEMQAKGSKKRYPGAFGYAQPSRLDRETEMSRQVGGGM